MDKASIDRIGEIKRRLGSIKYEKLALDAELNDLLDSCDHSPGFDEAGNCKVCGYNIDSW